MVFMIQSANRTVEFGHLIPFLDCLHDDVVIRVRMKGNVTMHQEVLTVLCKCLLLIVCHGVKERAVDHATLQQQR